MLGRRGAGSWELEAGSWELEAERGVAGVFGPRMGLSALCFENGMLDVELVRFLCDWGWEGRAWEI